MSVKNQLFDEILDDLRKSRLKYFEDYCAKYSATDDDVEYDVRTLRLLSARDPKRSRRAIPFSYRTEYHSKKGMEKMQKLFKMTEAEIETAPNERCDTDLLSEDEIDSDSSDGSVVSEDSDENCVVQTHKISNCLEERQIVSSNGIKQLMSHNKKKDSNNQLNPCYNSGIHDGCGLKPFKALKQRAKNSRSSKPASSFHSPNSKQKAFNDVICKTLRCPPAPQTQNITTCCLSIRSHKTHNKRAKNSCLSTPPSLHSPRSEQKICKKIEINPLLCPTASNKPENIDSSSPSDEKEISCLEEKQKVVPSNEEIMLNDPKENQIAPSDEKEISDCLGEKHRVVLSNEEIMLLYDSRENQIAPSNEKEIMLNDPKETHIAPSDEKEISNCLEEKQIVLSDERAEEYRCIKVLPSKKFKQDISSAVSCRSKPSPYPPVFKRREKCKFKENVIPSAPASKSPKIDLGNLRIRSLKTHN